ncbi:PTS galactitol transporter subunit IIC [Alkalibacter saccharofermentans]|uniref:PTS system, galactitol-specific IIC component n=1 Tax=Alkalibacter saccharofermentans DSM 14828 TaxID=1120975 RepID=A0A1M4UTQ8_9FIRM|nr:PTS transporter subunit IIC [Alkalibacter saccharofermentans]SHE60058.1 PTS system, galactitol-specific IIC component [Alkalibacter saccharofermentans DSM 14828]
MIAIVQYVLGLGATVMLPIIIFLLGTLMGAGFKRSFKSGIVIGVGFVGIGLVIGLLVETLGPAALAMLDRMGLNLSVIDVGWPAMASITWAWSSVAFVFPVCLGINFLMLTFKLTKTMNVDIWNYWQFAFIGAAVHFVTGSLVLALVAAGLASALALVLADYTAPLIEEFFGMPGMSFPHLTALGFLPLAIPLNYLIDKIPGINKINVSAEDVQKKFGIFGEPVMMGLFIGAILGFLAGFEIGAILQLAITMGAVMYLMPKMVAILMEGLIPISEAAREFMSKRFGDRDIYIGLDAAVALGEPSVIAVGLVLVPITIILALIIPGNTVLPFADLAVIPFLVCLVAALCRGNIVRSVLVGTIIMALVLVIATDISPIQTVLAQNAGIDFPEGATQIANLDRANFITWAFIRIFGIFG